MKTTTYTLCLWLNDKDTKKQEITSDNALELVTKFTVNYFWGGTTHLWDGVYSHDDWSIVIEKTLIIELITDKKIEEYVDILKQVFNQESVLVRKSIENVDFL